MIWTPREVGFCEHFPPSSNDLDAQTVRGESRVPYYLQTLIVRLLDADWTGVNKKGNSPQQFVVWLKN